MPGEWHLEVKVSLCVERKEAEKVRDVKCSVCYVYKSRGDRVTASTKGALGWRNGI